MLPVYVKPYVKRRKNDVADAQAICEAVTRPTMRFVAIKSREQQAALSLRARSLFIRQCTQLVNLMRSMLAELGIAIPVRLEKALQMARLIVDGEVLQSDGFRTQPTRSRCVLKSQIDWRTLS